MNYKVDVKNKLIQYRYNRAKYNLLKLDLEEKQLTEDYDSEKIRNIKNQIKEYKSKLEDVENLIRVLDTTERAFVILKYFEGKRYKDISVDLNLDYEYMAAFNSIVLNKIVNRVFEVV